MKVWADRAWDDYVWWQEQDRKVLKRIGKPEPLRHGFHGYSSRRITDEHRLVYKLEGDDVRIAACRYRYDSW